MLTPEQIAEMDGVVGGGLDAETMAQMDAVISAEQQPSFLASSVQPIKNIGPEISAAAQSGLDKITAPFPKPSGKMDYNIPRNLGIGLKDVGNRALGAVEYVGSPVAGVVRAIASQPLTDVAVSQGLPKQTAEDWIRTPVDVAGQLAAGAAAAKYGPQAFNAVKNSSFLKDTASSDLGRPVNALKEAFDAKKMKAVQTYILPKETPSQIADTITQRKLGGGIMNKVEYVPNESEKLMAQTALEAGVKPSAPIVKNVQVVNFALEKEAKKLKSVLQKSNVTISTDSLNRTGVSVAEKIAANPLVDEHGATVRKILEAGQAAIDSNPKTAAGMLQARIDFDRAITKFQPSAFNQDAPATAFRFAKDQVRQGMNDLISSSVPDAMVKQSLARQSSMYRIIDNLGSKAAEQGKMGGNRATRFLSTPTGKAAKYGAAAAGTYAVGNEVVGAINAGTK